MVNITEKKYRRRVGGLESDAYKARCHQLRWFCSPTRRKKIGVRLTIDVNKYTDDEQWNMEETCVWWRIDVVGEGFYCLAQSVAPCGSCCSWHVNIKGLWEVAIWEYLSGILTVFFPSYVIFMSSVIGLHIFMSKSQLGEISFLALRALIKSCARLDLEMCIIWLQGWFVLLSNTVALYRSRIFGVRYSLRMDGA